MAEGLIDALLGSSTSSSQSHFAIAPGIITENLDTLGEGRVKVRVTAMPGFEPWARVCSVGAGDGRGFCWIPQVDDEVLVAFAQNDASSAYVLGGLWSTTERPPIVDPLEFLTKRVIATGVAGGLGHTLEFDDLLQSVTITTSTQQKITIDPLKIQLSASVGTLTITLDASSQTISIQSPASIALKAPQISLEGVSVDIKGTTVGITAAGPITMQGLPIKLN